MEISRGLSCKGRLITLRIQVTFNDEEAEKIGRLGFYDVHIRTQAGGFGSKSAGGKEVNKLRKLQIGRVQDRWSIAVARTSGFTGVDVISTILQSPFQVLFAIVRLISGRRMTLSRLTRGITVKSTRIERIKEAEFFVFSSIAAVMKAFDYADGIGTEETYTADDVLTALDGLEFIEVGTANHKDAQDAQTVMKAFESL